MCGNITYIEAKNKKIIAAKILGIGRNTFSRKFKL